MNLQDLLNAIKTVNDYMLENEPEDPVEIHNLPVDTETGTVQITSFGLNYDSSGGVSTVEISGGTIDLERIID